jgi:hypothetical protein
VVPGGEGSEVYKLEVPAAELQALRDYTAGNGMIRGQHLPGREAARVTIFEYIEGFYDRAC